MSRTMSRETAYLVLFSNQFKTPEISNEVVLDVLDGKPISVEELDYIKSLVLGVLEHREELEAIVKNNLTGYAFERVVSTDLSAIMLATYELKYCKDTPSKVVINEAINLVKKYSTDKSFGFVNSVLSKISKELSDE
ncbi:MAG: transcription antitermination factor NusB [Clostridia bacterium]|nr:transcription antitermination factor NusB [Clostridia bacterium]